MGRGFCTSVPSKKSDRASYRSCGDPGSSVSNESSWDAVLGSDAAARVGVGVGVGGSARLPKIALKPVDPTPPVGTQGTLGSRSFAEDTLPENKPRSGEKKNVTFDVDVDVDAPPRFTLSAVDASGGRDREPSSSPPSQHRARAMSPPGIGAKA